MQQPARAGKIHKTCTFRVSGCTVLVCVVLAVFICLPVSGQTESGQLLTVTPEGSRMSAADYEHQGMVLMAQKNWSGLATMTDEGLALYPDDAELHCLRGYLLRKTGHFSEAVDNITFAIARDPKPIRYANRAFAYLALGCYNDALNDAGSAISLNLSYATAYGVRALALINTGNLTGAGQAVDTALYLDSANPLYWQLKGQISAAEGNCSAAREAFHTSLALDPSYDVPWPGFGNATTDLMRVESQCPAGNPIPTRSALLLVIAVTALVLITIIRSRR